MKSSSTGSPGGALKRATLSWARWCRAVTRRSLTEVDFEPDVRGALVGAPARREVLREVQAPAAYAVEVVVADLGGEADALVDDLGPQRVLGRLHLEPHGPIASVLDAVGDQLAHQQPHVRQHVRVERPLEVVECTPGHVGGLRRSW